MFTSDTTFLTLEGWKGYNTLSTRDKVATFNRKTGEIEYQYPIEVIKKNDYEGLLIHIKNINTNQLLTPEHQILLKKPYMKNYQKVWDSSWSFEYARALPKVVKTKGKLKLPLAGKYRQGTLSIGNYYAELLGWILTDGKFEEKCSGINIIQSDVHPAKVNRIRFLLDQLNVKYSEVKREYNVKDIFPDCRDRINTLHNFYLNASPFTERIRKDIPDKKPTWDLLQLKPSELISLFKGLLAGDSDLYAKSSRQKNGKLPNSCGFGQKDPNFREWFQALACLIGCRSKDSHDNKPTPVVNICGRDTVRIRKYHVTIKRTMNSIKVWGVETPNKTVICRRTTIEKNRAGEKIRKSYVFVTGGGNKS